MVFGGAKRALDPEARTERLTTHGTSPKVWHDLARTHRRLDFVASYSREFSMRKPLLLASALLLTSATFACKNPAKDEPAATVTDPAVAEAPVAEEAPAEPVIETQTIALNSENTKVEFVGSKVTESHEGGFNTVTGELTVAGTPESVRGNIEIDMKSTYTENERLTNHLLSDDFFLVEQFPTSTFVLTGVGNEVDGARTVTGNLTLRGVEKTIEFPATITVSETSVDLVASFAINRKDFGIEYAGQADNLIRDEVVIKFNVHAAR